MKTATCCAGCTAGGSTASGLAGTPCIRWPRRWTDRCGLNLLHTEALRSCGSIRRPEEPTRSHFRLVREPADPVVSPDGKWAAFTRTSATSEQIWIRNLTTGNTEEVAGGSCNNSSPAWELDSSAIVFASDCGRAFGLPALYRAPIAGR